MARVILCLDPATRTGYCVAMYGANGRVDGHTYVYGVWDLKPSRFDGGGMRLLRLRDQLIEIIRKAGVTHVYIEEVRAHKGTDAAHLYGAITGMIMAVCEDLKIPYQSVGVGQIKRFFTGKGNADKAMMVETAQKYYPDITDHNIADAFALAMYAVAHNPVEAKSPALMPDAGDQPSRVLS